MSLPLIISWRICSGTISTRGRDEEGTWAPRGRVDEGTWATWERAEGGCDTKARGEDGPWAVGLICIGLDSDSFAPTGGLASELEGCTVDVVLVSWFFWFASVEFCLSFKSFTSSFKVLSSCKTSNNTSSTPPACARVCRLGWFLLLGVLLLLSMAYLWSQIYPCTHKSHLFIFLYN